jgi:hypothetical protein
MKNKKFLIALAFLGTLLGWSLTDIFIIKLSILQFIGIEILITLFHGLYNQTKLNIIKNS